MIIQRVLFVLCCSMLAIGCGAAREFADEAHDATMKSFFDRFHKARISNNEQEWQDALNGVGSFDQELIAYTANNHALDNEPDVEKRRTAVRILRDLVGGWQKQDALFNRIADQETDADVRSVLDEIVEMSTR